MSTPTKAVMVFGTLTAVSAGCMVGLALAGDLVAAAMFLVPLISSAAVTGLWASEFFG